MKVYFLNTGTLKTERKNVVVDTEPEKKQELRKGTEMVNLPVLAVLIEAEGEYVLYDLGSHPKAMEGHWAPHITGTYTFCQKEEELLENQLALCGVEPKDIKTVVLSHLHLDHAGNIHKFTHADIYVPKADFIHGQTTVRINPNPLTHGGYTKADLDVVVKEFHLVEEDFELLPGIDVVNLPGHSPGLLGLVLHLECGALILPSDSVYTKEIYGPPSKISAVLHDVSQFLSSIEKVRELEKKHNAKVIFSHDEEQFKTLNLAPEWYE